MSGGYAEQAVAFDCEGETLIGIVAKPVSAPVARGVLIVVGGPQYRVGSHRQFLLLARDLAAHGIPCMRFDYRGMGDSSGLPRSFETVSADIGAAVDCFVRSVPGMTQVVLWGLCDAASAASFYAVSDKRIESLVLLNPWVRTQAGEAKAYLKHYYVHRLFDWALWRRIFAGRFDFRASFSALTRMVSVVMGEKLGPDSRSADAVAATLPLPDRMANALERFSGSVMLILSGNDLTAREFIDATATPAWVRLFAQPRVIRFDLPVANHTFSTRVWRDIVASQTRAWVLER